MFSARRHDTADRPRERRHTAPDAVAVIGLGRFGSALARELMRNGAEVLGVDDSENTVRELNGRLTTVARVDATREEALRQLGVDEFDKVVVGIGTDIQASVLVASRLLKFDRPGSGPKPSPNRTPRSSASSASTTSSAPSRTWECARPT